MALTLKSADGIGMAIDIGGLAVAEQQFKDPTLFRD